MCAAVDGTNNNGEGKIDADNNFEEWLKSQKVSNSLITKIKEFGMDSIEMLREIDTNDAEQMKNIGNEMNLTSIERIKFKVIVKNIPRHKLNTVIDPKEREAILEMEKKLKAIKTSMTNLDGAKKEVQNETEKCCQLITATYEEIVNKVIARKEILLQEAKAISNKKFVSLEKAYEEMKANSVIATTHIDSCYEAINKRIDLTAIDQRKENILKVAKIVNVMNIIDKNNVLIKDCNIDFNCNVNTITDVINKSGNFLSVPCPILLAIENKFGKVKLKWKLQGVDEEVGNKINKLKVEWSDTEIKLEDNNNFDELKVDWNFNKIFEVNNISNEQNETEIILKNKGNYLFRLQCMIDDTVSKVSNVKSISFDHIFRWTHTYTAEATLEENGTRVKSKTKNCSWVSTTSSTGWNSGKYCWKIRLNDGYNDHRCDGVGVTTDYAGASKPVWLRDLGKSLWYSASGTCIYKGKTKAKTGVDRWNPGDIMTVMLDCDAWKITFHLNDKDLGTYELEPNQTYYPALNMCGCEGYDLQLI
eukprot:417208_1